MPTSSDKKNSEINSEREVIGFMPSFMNSLVDQSIPEAWSEAKTFNFSYDIELGPKIKTLIAIAVGAQVPCPHIKHIERTSAAAQNISRQDQHEAVLMSAITRHWSTVLNGSLIERGTFRKEADITMSHVKKMMANAKGQMPPAEMFQVKPISAKDTLIDIEKTLGLVPKLFKLFPKKALAGAWSEFKCLQLSPFTSLNGKEKSLIGLAVASQIPCYYGIYFQKSAAVLHGASAEEMEEAIAMAALTRHWSTLFHGPEITIESFKRGEKNMQ